MAKPAKPRERYAPLNNARLRKFVSLANRRYFGGKLEIAKVCFSRLKKDRHGETQSWIYEQLWGPKATHLPIKKERYHILIHTRLRRHRDLCLMTVYHEMAHTELLSQGLTRKEVSCHKSGHRFNRVMKRLARAGAFNGLW